MNRKDFIKAEWEAMVERMPGLPPIAKEAKALFDSPGVLMVFGKRKAEPGQPKYVDPFQDRTT